MICILQWCILFLKLFLIFIHSFFAELLKSYAISVMPNNYNSVAFFYDSLNRIVFGNSTIRSQVWLLQQIPANASILVIGGGTGWILEKLAEVHSSGLHIIYI